MEEFVWFPVASHSRELAPRVISARFGDGYEQRTVVGINSDPEVWSLEFSGNRVEMEPIDAFLRAHKGAHAFLWKTPDEQTKKFICRRWKKSRANGVIVTISCDFEQVFE